MIGSGSFGTTYRLVAHADRKSMHTCRIGVSRHGRSFLFIAQHGALALDLTTCRFKMRDPRMMLCVTEPYKWHQPGPPFIGQVCRGDNLDPHAHYFVPRPENQV